MNRRAATLLLLSLAVLPSACQTGPDLLADAVPLGQAGPGRQKIVIPTAAGDMPAWLHLPEGPGPFPLAVIAHGSDQDPAGRVAMRMPEFRGLTGWLLARGHAVLLPLRPGHGRAGGRFVEDQGGCGTADYVGSGLAAARLIEAAIGHVRQLPQIRRDGTVVIGHSAGGWAAIALASRNPAGVRAIVSFSGGRGGRNRGRAGENCAPERLIAAARQFGATARIPALWLYAGNDSWFAPQLATALAEAYRSGGAPLRFELLPPSAGEGHFLIHEPESRWGPALQGVLSGA